MIRLSVKQATLSMVLGLVVVVALIARSIISTSSATSNQLENCPDSLILRGKEFWRSAPEMSGLADAWPDVRDLAQKATEIPELLMPESVFSEMPIAWELVPSFIDKPDTSSLVPQDLELPNVFELLPDSLNIPDKSSLMLVSLEVPDTPGPFVQATDLSRHMSLLIKASKFVPEVSRLSGNQLTSKVMKWEGKAEALLEQQGFEDSDGDGKLNWPADSPLVGGQNLDVVLVATESTGVVIGFIPVAGDIVDGAALVIGRDPVTGECLTRTDQLLFGLSLLLVVPVSAKSVKFAWRLFSNSAASETQRAWKFLDLTFPDVQIRQPLDLPGFSKRLSESFVNLSDLSRLNRVARKYNRFRVVTGRSATSSEELAGMMGFKSKRFSESNYREALIAFTGKTKEEVLGLEAHHILPQEFGQSFQRRGIETVHDPRFLIWLTPGEHKKLGKHYNEAWKVFLAENPDASDLRILEEARELTKDFGKDVLFRTSRWNLLERFGWPIHW